MQIQSQFIWSVQAQSNLLTDSKTNKWIKRFSDGVSRSSKLKLEDLINLQLNIVSLCHVKCILLFFFSYFCCFYFVFFVHFSSTHRRFHWPFYGRYNKCVHVVHIGHFDRMSHVLSHVERNIIFKNLSRVMPRSHQPSPHTKKHRSELFVLHNISIFNSFIKHHFRHVS